MQIPDRFKIYGRTIEVEWVDRVHDMDFHNGCALYDSNKILLSKRMTNKGHVYCHELTHILLNASGRDDLSQDEAFVEVFSGLLHQVLTTSEKCPKKTRYVDPQPNGTVTTTL